MPESQKKRTVFIVSDGTGITAETFSHSVLSQFSADFDFTLLREPFITSEEKAAKVAEKINATALEENTPPLLFSTLVKPEILAVVQQSNCIFLDIFGACVSQLETALDTKSRPTIGLSHLSASSKQYRNRIEAINFTLAHDDGQFVHGLKEADVILVGVSRCGKTPTSLYLAMQYAIKAANFPLIPEDFERGALPKTLLPYRNKLFGLSIQPDRLSEVRNERRPDSQYASIKQCLYEVGEAERLMRRESIEWLSTTTKSIEEISTTVIQILGLKSPSTGSY
ncbi:posphoenolpyruvate synthetase regulatory kinase/phosphorylase PpsR [Advenella mimigardefordensis]|uniref:Putative phosphoenolpyruvate synthase regulatory protein n=1 Tax=Advenella mimigardefordensis (strain DSM 17166 / LMG 22922 / DPN7) TaxID=1247726 RepID=W0PFF5_ADVMD|nr:pyruvate, water dikinase regulatory protein [Advenella mimigardefordensis]AHG64030.1 putative phosphotransferase [Advenella mimigardefordensis DPN7]